MTTTPQAAPAAGPLKRLVLCFDGTWNTPEDQTNVSRIYSAIADQHSGCDSQLKFYDEGVGTSARTRFAGGVFGLGLDQNILEGYCWLINQYAAALTSSQEPAPTTSGEEVFAAGPEIFLFGFSRGAYTARSLAGLINRCGLPRWNRSDENGKPVPIDPKEAIVQEAWQLYQTKFDKNKEARYEKPCADFRTKNCHNVTIRFIGVWDSVGALGVPMFSTKGLLSRLSYGFHDTGLGRVIENAYHAIAIDEQREDYQVTLWETKHSSTRDVEQRWFPGAHANVGGGYEDDLLPEPPLRWIALRAIAHGLEFIDEMKIALAEKPEPTCKVALPRDFELQGDEYLSPVRDSYAAFLHGAYRFFRTLAFRGRFYRPMLVGGVNETIDETAQMKWAADPRYRPKNFAHAGRAESGPARFATPVTAAAAPEASGGA